MQRTTPTQQQRTDTPDFIQYNPISIDFPTKKSAIDFLHRAGIVTKKGKLTKIYRTSN
jgi:hypothetical protein